MKDIRIVCIMACILIAGSFFLSAAGTAEESPEVKADQPVSSSQGIPRERQENRMKIEANGHIFTASLVENSTTEKLIGMLGNGPITIDMRDYGNMEKVGSFDTDLPRNDEPIDTDAGDLILYQGRAFVIYYDTNSWNFTRIGKIENTTGEELKRILGPGSVTVTLSLE